MIKTIMDKHGPGVPEFSRLFPIDRLAGAGEVGEALVATPDERRALAARFGLVALDSLHAEVALRQIGRGPVVRLEGRLFADVVQTCVVSLEPVASRVEDRFVLHYAPEGQGGPPGHILEGGSGDEEELPEPFVEGRIDIGEAVAQQLALALDPYPRKPGVRLEDVIGRREGLGVDEPPASPFAVLAGLARRKS